MKVRMVILFPFDFLSVNLIHYFFCQRYSQRRFFSLWHTQLLLICSNILFYSFSTLPCFFSSLSSFFLLSYTFGCMFAIFFFKTNPPLDRSFHSIYNIRGPHLRRTYLHLYIFSLNLAKLQQHERNRHSKQRENNGKRKSQKHCQKQHFIFHIIIIQQRRKRIDDP